MKYRTMDNIGQCIILKQILSISQASEVCCDLEQLNTNCVWDVPAWATELAEHYEIPEAHSIIQSIGWRAVAKAYKDAWERKIWNELGQ